MSKSPEAFRTISEVAQELALPQHVLRFWETRFTSIKPMKRGGGRRYYRPDDVDLLRGIRALLYGEGYTIRGVQRILKEQGPRSIIAAARGVGIPAPAPVARVVAAVEISPGEIARRAPPPPPPPEFDDDEDEADEVAVRTDPVLSAPDRSPAFSPPVFKPKEFRAVLPARSPGSALSGPTTLSAEDVRRLEATLADLLELKRLVDSARD